MNRTDKIFLALLVLAAALLAIAGTLGANSQNVTRISDSCYHLDLEDNRVFGRDIHVSGVYCEREF